MSAASAILKDFLANHNIPDECSDDSYASERLELDLLRHGSEKPTDRIAQIERAFAERQRLRSEASHLLNGVPLTLRFANKPEEEGEEMTSDPDDDSHKVEEAISEGENDATEDDMSCDYHSDDAGERQVLVHLATQNNRLFTMLYDADETGTTIYNLKTVMKQEFGSTTVEVYLFFLDARFGLQTPTWRTDGKSIYDLARSTKNSKDEPYRVFVCPTTDRSDEARDRAESCVMKWYEEYAASE